MTIVVLALGAIAALLTYGLTVAGRRWIATAPTLFLVLQAPFFAGLFQHLDPDESTELWYAVFTVVGLWAFVVGALMANVNQRFQPGRRWHNAMARPLRYEQEAYLSRLTIVVAAIISLAVGVVFVRAIGYNTFLVALRGISGDQRLGFSELRYEATRGSYVAAGYASQFTAILLPAIILLLIVRTRVQPSLPLRVFALTLLVADLYFITAVGGRAYLLEFFLSYWILSVPVLAVLPRLAFPSKQLRRLLLPAFLCLFLLATQLQGRSSPEAAGGDSGLLSLPLDSVAGLYQRLGGDYANYQLQSIRILAPEGISWGRQWLREMTTVLPGPTTTETLDVRLHRELFGSSTGNAPLNIWGSVYLNWGFFGGVALLTMAGYLFQSVSIRLLERAERTVPILVLGHLICFRLALVRDPYSFLLEGLATLSLVRLWLRRASRSAALESDVPGLAAPQRAAALSAAQ